MRNPNNLLPRNTLLLLLGDPKGRLESMDCPWSEFWVCPESPPSETCPDMFRREVSRRHTNQVLELLLADSFQYGGAAAQHFPLYDGAPHPISVCTLRRKLSLAACVQDLVLLAMIKIS